MLINSVYLQQLIYIFESEKIFMTELNQILTYLSTNKSRLEKAYHLKKIGVFGSMARGEQNSLSDIDLIVEFEDNTTDLFTIKQQLRDEIHAEFHVPVDICREKYIKPIFRNRILAEAKYV
jgi:predicted nucleotidyltransferase